MGRRRLTLPILEFGWLRPAAATTAGALFVLAACSGPDTAKPGGDPATGGRYKVGLPYTINGITYRPAIDEAYNETGTASWYGPKFHGRKTANGEIFDMNELSAAHPTLPMPSMVRVTNLANGRTIALRVNDRGPFAHGRIIDISRRGAQLLGFRYKGVTRVRVEVMKEESRRVAAIAGGMLPPPAAEEGPALLIVRDPLPRTVPVVETTRLPAAKARPEETETRKVESGDRRSGALGAVRRYFVQAGAFESYNNAIRLWTELSPLGPTAIVPGDDRFSIYRVRLGPYEDVTDAEGMAAMIAARGRPDAHVITD